MSEDKPQANISALFTQFVNLRKAGKPVSVAWQAVQEAATTLPQTQRQQLAVMAQAWEAREGGAHRKHEQENDDTITEIPRRDQLETMIRDAGTIKPLPSQQRTQNGSTVPAKASKQYFDEAMQLLFYISGVEKPLSVRVAANNEVIVGRSAPDNILLPDIDLGPYNGHSYGVSRVHASIKRKNDVLVISDLGSKNRTYVNGKPLQEIEERLLEDGDELRFGDFVTRIQFQKIFSA